MQEGSPAYWLDLFTGTTWDEFRKAGATITGFRQRSAGVCKRIQPGDILICYLTGVKRWGRRPGGGGTKQRQDPYLAR